MPKRTPGLTVDPATGRVYIVTEWGERNGEPVALDRTDVTDVYLEIVRYHSAKGQPSG